jgi:acyl-coenzyme A synthetase/AMP-(fatty) acid ligase
MMFEMRDAHCLQVLCPDGGAAKLQDLTAAEGVPLLPIAAEEVAAFSDHHPPDPPGTASSSGSTSASTKNQWQQQRACWGSDAGSLVIYTSGTTGRPKGALHTHGWVLDDTGSARCSDMQFPSHCT